MATVTVRLDGTGDALTVTAGCLLGGVGDTISITEAGTYVDETPVLQAGQTVRNDSGGVVILKDVALRATYMITGAAGSSITGCTLQWRSNFAYVMDGRFAGFSLTGNVLECLDAPLAGTFYILHATGGSVLISGCTDTGTSSRYQLALCGGGTVLQAEDLVLPLTGTALGTVVQQETGDTLVLRRIRTGTAVVAINGATGSVILDNCYQSGAGYHASILAATATDLTVLSSGSVGDLLEFQGGAALHDLEIRGSCAGILVTGVATLSGAFTGSYNIYNTTAAGTSSATDKNGITQLGLTGPLGIITPQSDSPLYRRIPPSAGTMLAFF